MKKALKALPVILAFVVLTAFAPAHPENGIKKENDRVEVTFNRKMDFNDLVKVRFELLEDGISVEYKLLEFDENGGLKSIAFEVDCHDGFSGSAKSTKIYNNTEFGFFRDYNKEADSPFGTGTME